MALGLLAAACTSSSGGELTSSAVPGTGPLSTSSTTAPGPDSSGGSNSGSTDPGGEDAGAPAVEFDVDPVEWRPCGAGDCADLEVPLDHSDPTGDTITVAMSRLPASGPADQRLGSIFVNFGGPGGEGTETILSFEIFIPAELRERFDIVSWDPRGVEDTAGLGCDGVIGDEPTDLVDPTDGFADDEANDREVWDRVMDCVATSPIIDDIGTVAVVNDLELMRRAVGDDQLTYLGFSYGTEIGWVYATLYSDNVRAMVLDGAVPPSNDLESQTLDQLTAIQAAIERWNTGCDQSPDCPLRDEGYEATILRLMTELEADPIPLADGTTYGPVDLGNMVISMTYLDQTDWGPTFVEMVESLDNGDVEPLVGLAAAFEGGSEDATFWSVLCADGATMPAGSDPEALYAEVYELSPIVGRLPGSLFCETFPGEIDGLPELDTTGTPPLLVIGNTGDNATPYSDAVRLDELLADSVLLTYDGPGHTITFFNGCIDRMVTEYFLDVQPPSSATRCGNRSTTGEGWFVPIGD